MQAVTAGRGKTNRPLLAIVGMNPGKEECKQGLPFVGASGQILSEFLRRAGVDEADCYFTNVVKNATPGNREPTITEAKEWREHFIKEIQDVRPKVIVPLGSFAAKEVAQGGKISETQGQPTKPLSRLRLDEGTQVVPSYHPAAALRNPSYGEAIVRALSFAASLGSGRGLEISPKIVWVEKLKDPEAMQNVTNQILQAKVITYDIETNARDVLDPLLCVYLVAIDVGEWTFVFGPQHNAVIMGTSLLVPSSRGKDLVLAPQKYVGHNAIRFDAPVLQRVLPAVSGLEYCTDDTMLLDYLLDENAASHALEAACFRVLGAQPWKDIVTWSWHDTPPENIPWERAVEYCARDARATRLLYDNLMPRLDNGSKRVYTLLRGAAPALQSVERNGVFIDRDYARSQNQKLTEEIDDTRQKLRVMVKDPSFNPNSSSQVRNVLFKTLGVRPPRITVGGNPSTDEESLKLIMASADDTTRSFAKGLLSFREAVKLKSTYFEPYLTLLGDDSRIHPGYGLTTTKTGRTSSFRPNFENVPRASFVRKLIAAPPGKVFLSADFSQLELRIAAQVANEKNMLAAFVRGDDLHSLFAQKITGRQNVTKEERYAAKVGNFLLLYGGEEYTFQRQALLNYDLSLTMEQCTMYRNVFYESWPGLPEWHRIVSEEIIKTGQVRSITGQIRRLPQIYAQDRPTKLEALRKGINFTVQNPAAHLGILALTLCVQEFGGDPDTIVVGFVHDAICLETVPDKLNDVATKVVDIMERRVVQSLAWLDPENPVNITVPLKADIEVGPSWGELKKMTLPSAMQNLSGDSTLHANVSAG